MGDVGGPVLAALDPLTGLANRHAFLALLADAVTIRADRTRVMSDLIVAVLDIDGLRHLNTRHGDAEGDRLLAQIAGRLDRRLAEGEAAARLGEDSFGLLLLPPHGLGDAGPRLASLRASLEGAVDHAFSVSIGATAFLEGGAAPEHLLHSAEIALREAKALGTGQTRFFDRALGAAEQERRTVLAQFETGLARGELEAHYQPIVDLRTLKVRGLEALARWRHPQRGLLSPAAFLPALADPELSAALGRIMLRQALAHMRSWLDARVPAACVNVNVSESQLRDGDGLLRQVSEGLREFGLPPDRLKLEILESAFIGDHASDVAATMARLRNLGVVIALDDFGTGYASLKHLKQFDVGRIKIDQSFTRDFGTEPASTAITRAIIDLGRSLDMRVTAEGVEELPQLALLLAAECDCAQGYLFSRPMPADAVPAFLRRWRHEGSLLIEAARRLAMAPQHPPSRRTLRSAEGAVAMAMPTMFDRTA